MLKREEKINYKCNSDEERNISENGDKKKYKWKK